MNYQNWIAIAKQTKVNNKKTLVRTVWTFCCGTWHERLTVGRRRFDSRRRGVKRKGAEPNPMFLQHLLVYCKRRERKRARAEKLLVEWRENKSAFDDCSYTNSGQGLFSPLNAYPGHPGAPPRSPPIPEQTGAISWWAFEIAIWTTVGGASANKECQEKTNSKQVTPSLMFRSLSMNRRRKSEASWCSFLCDQYFRFS